MVLIDTNLIERINKFIQTNINDIVDPEKILALAIKNMQSDLIELRQTLANAIEEQHQIQYKYNGKQAEASQWQLRAKLAVSTGNDSLAREALKQKNSSTEKAAILKIKLDKKTAIVNQFRETQRNLENKMTETLNIKNSLQVQKLMETIIHLSQLGDSLGISIPEQIVQSLNLKANDTLICKLENGKVILEPLQSSSEYSLDELLAAEIEPSEEVDWGKPEGSEIW